jgi:hypothetical protein
MNITTYQRYTPNNFIKIDLTTAQGSMRCLICNESETLPQKDDFLGVSVWVTDSQGFRRTKFLDTPKKKPAHFESTHLQLHFNITSRENKKAKKKAVTI